MYANQVGGVPDFLAAVPTMRRLRCDDTGDPTSGDDDAFYVERERFFAPENSKYGIAWVKLLTGKWVYGDAFLPENADPGVTIVPADAAIETYCP